MNSGTRCGMLMSIQCQILGISSWAMLDHEVGYETCFINKRKKLHNTENWKNNGIWCASLYLDIVE